MNNNDFIALMEQYEREELLSVQQVNLMNKFYKKFVPRVYASSLVRSEEGKALKASLYKQQNRLCYNPLCPNPVMAIEQLQMDHKVPLELMKHRANKLENFALLCCYCNIRKGKKLVDFAKGW